MATVTIEEAKASLVDLIHQLQPDEEVVITENNQPVARLIPLTVRFSENLANREHSEGL